MRILFVCAHQVWPPVTGARLRNFHLANALAKRAAVTLLQLRPPGEKEIAGVEELRHFERVLTFERERSYTLGKIVSGLLGPSPLPILNYFSPKAAELFRQLVTREDFDAVQFEGVHLLHYVRVLGEPRRPPNLIVDWHNIESELMRRYSITETNWPKKLVARRTASLLEAAENQLLRSSRIHTVASERERELLLARHCGNDIRVIGNGVEVLRFAQVTSPSVKSKSVLFVGSMDYHANIDAVIWFAQQIWPDIHAQFPDLIFTIAGRDPGPQIRNLVSNSVHVTGTVADVRPYYEEAFAVVVPLRVGGGTRLKILEAMAAGVPVISTRLGAEGLEVENEAHILLADTPAEIVSALDRLRGDGALWRRLACRARLLVSEKYNWDSLGGQLFRMHEEQVAVAHR